MIRMTRVLVLSLAIAFAVAAGTVVVEKPIRGVPQAECVRSSRC